MTLDELITHLTALRWSEQPGTGLSPADVGACRVYVTAPVAKEMCRTETDSVSLRSMDGYRVLIQGVVGA